MQILLSELQRNFCRRDFRYAIWIESLSGSQTDLLFRLSDRSLCLFDLRRRLIDVILQKARSARYRDAVRYVREIESQQSEVTDFGRHESHAEYMACLKREHARKSGFWKLFP